MIVRAKYDIEEQKDGRSQIVFTEIPYQLTKEPLLKKLAELVNAGRVTGVTDIVDESDRKQPVRIVVKVKKGEDPNVVLNQLYQFSPLQDTFSVIMLALVDGRPRTLPLKELLRLFVEHRVNVIRRRTQYQLRQARARAHIVEGLLIALALHRRDHPGDPLVGQPGRGPRAADGPGGLGRDPPPRPERPRGQGRHQPDPDAGRRDPRHAAPAADRPGGRQARAGVHRPQGRTSPATSGSWPTSG